MRTWIRALALAWSVSTMASAAAPKPGQSTAEAIYDFGTVRQGAHISHTFVVKNPSNAPLRIIGAALSVQGMNVRVETAEVPPHGEVSVAVEFNTERVAGAIDAEALVQWNDPAHPEMSLRLRGAVIPPIAIEPIPAVFLSAATGETAQQTLTIRNNAAQPLEISQVEHSDHLVVSVTNVEPGRVFAVTVRTAPGLPAGHYEESLTFVTGNSAESRIKLPVHLWIKAEDD